MLSHPEDNEHLLHQLLNYVSECLLSVGSEGVQTFK